jgi:CRISPR-associated protein Cas1
MKKLLNTLYITTNGAALRKDGQNVVAEIEGAERGRAPLHMLSSIVTFGSISISPALIGACAGAGITIVLLDRAGRFQARIEGPVSGNVLLRRAQYRASESPLEIVRSLVMGKISNQRAVLMRSLRDYGPEMEADRREAVVRSVDRMAIILRRVSLAGEGTEQLRGAEGEAANLYFGVFDCLIRSLEPELRFRKRSRRPPLDPINALLSFLYALLTHDCRSAAESIGLDPAVGFLHRDRPGRPSLALDLMEELRPVFADRLALSLVNRRQVSAQDFESRDGSAVFLSEDGRRTVLTAGAQEGRASPSLSERERAARPHALPSGAASGEASTRRSRRLSALVLEVRPT